MSKWLVLLMTVASCAAGEVHTMSLRQVAERALKESPDMITARLNEQKAAEQVRVARDPFFPKVFVGSGLAYSNGFPMSIEGSAPSIVQARAVASIFNRKLRYQVAEARENARGAALDTLARRDQILLRAVQFYLDAELAALNVEMARREIDGLERVADVIRLRVADGRELPIDAKRAALDIARARQRVEVFESDQLRAEGSLAMVLGFDPGDRVRAAAEERTPPKLPESEEAAVKEALEGSKEVRRLESAMLAKELEVRAQKSARLPQFDLVAQYAVFARFNNYADFFQRFERNNGQLGVSIQVPVLTGPATNALAADAQADVTRLRLQVNTTRSRIDLDTRQSYQEVKRAESAAEVARLDLDLARENLTVLLARMDEGRASLRDVEAARFQEHEKWIAFYGARHTLEVARFGLLKQTGALIAALR